MTDGESERDKHESTTKTAETREMNGVVRDTKRYKEKKLSSHQRDVIQIDLSSKELALKRQAIQVMKESTKSTEADFKAKSSSIPDIVQNVNDELTRLTCTMVQCQQLSQIQMHLIHSTRDHSKFKIFVGSGIVLGAKQI